MNALLWGGGGGGLRLAMARLYWIAPAHNGNKVLHGQLPPGVSRSYLMLVCLALPAIPIDRID